MRNIITIFVLLFSLSAFATNPTLTEQEPSKKEKIVQPSTPTIPLNNALPTFNALIQIKKQLERERRYKQVLAITRAREAYTQYLIRSLDEQLRAINQHLDELSKGGQELLLRISVKSNGDLIELKIAQPSSSSKFNEIILAAALAAAPFKPLPESWKLDRTNFFIIFNAAPKTKLK